MSLVLTPAALSPSIDLEHQLAGRVGQRVADRVHLDADDVARLEEAAPGLDRVGGAGQLLHAPVDGRVDRLAVLDVVLDHPRIADLDDPAGIGARDAPLLVRPRPCRRPPWAPGPRRRSETSPPARGPRHPRPGTGGGRGSRRDRVHDATWRCSSKSIQPTGVLRRCGRSPALQRQGYPVPSAAATTGPALRPRMPALDPRLTDLGCPGDNDD